MSWAEVHDEAERLEHAASDKLIDRIDNMLGRPATDPHGDPIPDSSGSMVVRDYQTLLTCPLDAPVVLTRVTDQDAAFLRFPRGEQSQAGPEAARRGPRRRRRPGRGAAAGATGRSRSACAPRPSCRSRRRRRKARARQIRRRTWRTRPASPRPSRGRPEIPACGSSRRSPWRYARPSELLSTTKTGSPERPQRLQQRIVPAAGFMRWSSSRSNPPLDHALDVAEVVDHPAPRRARRCAPRSRQRRCGRGDACKRRRTRAAGGRSRIRYVW